MNISDPKHPIWIILYQIVPATVLILLCLLMYKSGLVPKDFFLPIAVSVSQLIVSIIKSYATTQPSN